MSESEVRAKLTKLGFYDKDSIITSNTDEINVESEKNHMILFPSTCYHAAPTNVNEERRISLSFNTWIRGNIGSDEMCTKLNLK